MILSWLSPHMQNHRHKKRLHSKLSLLLKGQSYYYSLYFYDIFKINLFLVEVDTALQNFAVFCQLLWHFLNAIN